MGVRIAGRVLLIAAALFAGALFVAAYFQADVQPLIRVAAWGSAGLALAGCALAVTAWLGRTPGKRP